MPNSNNHDEQRLSALLNQAEPPKSPRHLDDLILGYAKKHAAENINKVNQEKDHPAKKWFNHSWVPAAATFSLAIVAVSVTFQSFNQTPSDPERVSGGLETSLLAENENKVDEILQLPISRRVSAPIQSIIELEEARSQAPPAVSQIVTRDSILDRNTARSDDRTSRQSDGVPANKTLAVTSLDAAPESAASPAALQIEISNTSAPQTPARERSAADIVLADDAIVSVEIASSNLKESFVVIETVNEIATEELQAITGTGAAAEVAEIGVSADASNVPLDETDLASDRAAQLQLLTLLDEVLNLSAANGAADLDQSSTRISPNLNRANQSLRRTEAVRLVSADAEISQDLQTRAGNLSTVYHQLTDGVDAQNAVNRYLERKANFTEFSLPETLDLAIILLESIDFQ